MFSSAMAHIRKRTTAAGTRFQAVVKTRGFPSARRTFSKHRHARAWAADVEQYRLNGHAVPGAVEERHTVQQMIERYLREMWARQPQKQRSAKIKERELQWWATQLGDCSLAELNAPKILEAMLKLAEAGRAAATVNHYCASFRSVCSEARQSWRWLTRDPFDGVKKYKEPSGRTRHASAAELRLIFTSASREGRKYLVVLVLLVATGARKNELLHLRHRDLNPRTGVALVEDSKSGRPRTLYITGSALDLLLDFQRRNPGRPGDYIFRPRGSRKPLNIDNWWRGFRRRIGLDDFRIHDLRHTLASLLAGDSCSLLDIAAALGHAKVDTTQRYAHLLHGHVHGVVEQSTARHIAPILNEMRV